MVKQRRQRKPDHLKRILVALETGKPPAAPDFGRASCGGHRPCSGRPASRYPLAAYRGCFAPGGLGFFLGDGRISYRPETIIETFNSLNVVNTARVSFDCHRVYRPVCKDERGPVNVGPIRLHAEF